MFRPRIIPVLLLNNNSLVKSVRFKNYNYIGDPMNAVKLFNEFKADELVFLDIKASQQNRLISLDLVRAVGEEANMPFAVGGGIRSLKDIQEVTSNGAEKVILSSQAIKKPEFIKQASETFGSSTIVVCIDVKKNLFKNNKVFINNGKSNTKIDPLEMALLAESQGAGEIIIQSIDRDGLMAGYDIALIKMISEKVSIPVVALGGAGDFEHIKECYKATYSNAMAGGSFFVYHGSEKGVLISYPNSDLIEQLR
jgi:cyclase|tara:strand:+ start:43 stop:801 length:759 start_codon:yes stop_codon:yes gene_type:complete